MESTSLNQSINFDGDDQLETTMCDQRSGKTKKFRESSSDVWNYFVKKGISQDGIQKAECKGCKKEYRCGGKQYGTSTLRRHLQSCKMLKFHDIGQMIIDHEGKMRSKKIDQKIARELLAATVIRHDLPFSYVEYDGIRALMKYLNPNVVCISRNTLIYDVTRIYLRVKEKLQKCLANIQNRICLTSDVWTACTSEGYISLTAHFVDDDWKLNSKILSFAHMPPPHSGVELAAKLFEFLKDWRIEENIFFFNIG